MKKTILFVSFLCCLATTKAQIQQGNVLVGGDIADFSLGLNDGGAFNVSLNPKAAWFVRNGIALGAYANLGLNAAKYIKPSTSYGVGALGRYYLTDANATVLRKTRFFAEATVGIEGYNPGEGSNTNGLGMTAGPGVAYFVTPNIGLEALAKYRGIVGFGSSVTSSNLMLGIGFQIYLSRNKIESEMNGIKN
ncbi:MAG: hypothetical protein QM802_20790 [Agriterribacter sp.]